MPVPTNYIIKASNKSLFDDASGILSSTVSFSQGDLMIIDVGVDSKLKQILSGTNDATNFLGVARESVVNGSYKSSYQGTDVDASQAASLSQVVGPEYGCVAKVLLKAGDTIAPGALIYPALSASSSRQVTATAGGLKAIGIYVGAVSVTAGSNGQDIECLIGARYPNDSLKF